VLSYVAVAATGAALVLAGYHSMAPTSQLYGSTFIGEARPSRRLALTFDDGPSDPSTLRLLEVLERHRIRATFFMIGRHIARHPSIACAVAAAGHEIGNHTETHPLLTVHTARRVRREIETCEQRLQETVGPLSRLFRPPYGGRRPGVLRQVRAQGLQTVMWNVAGKDWKTQSPQLIESTLCGAIRGGDVILLHDGAPGGSGRERLGTVEAVDRIIPRLQDQGYRFLTVGQMLATRQTIAQPSPGVVPNT
jgi:peptidoglycan/xylan/chitin deacetylase (PgdA/CDA1 family)